MPRVRQQRATKLQGSSKPVLSWQVTMDQLICASPSHTTYWHEVGVLEVPATYSMSRSVYMFIRHIQERCSRKFGRSKRSGLQQQQAARQEETFGVLAIEFSHE